MAEHPHPVDPERVAAARDVALPRAEAQSLAALLTLLADPLRARILSALLVTEEMCVGDIAMALDVSEDSASYALRLLRTAGLVQRRAEGRMGYYRLRDGEFRERLVTAVDHLRALAEAHPERFADRDGAED